MFRCFLAIREGKEVTYINGTEKKKDIKLEITHKCANTMGLFFSSKDMMEDVVLFPSQILGGFLENKDPVTTGYYLESCGSRLRPFKLMVQQPQSLIGLGNPGYSNQYNQLRQKKASMANMRGKTHPAIDLVCVIFGGISASTGNSN